MLLQVWKEQFQNETEKQRENNNVSLLEIRDSFFWTKCL